MFFILRHLHPSFNPRTRTGCDLLDKGYRPGDWGFNPRTRTGCDLLVFLYAQTISMFQPTHPHGVRQPANQENPRIRSFNPRTRTGCDRSSTRGYQCVTVSTHAPARGATNGEFSSCFRIVVSTHAPARGATKLDNIKRYETPSFNPRTRTGCDGSEC